MEKNYHRLVGLEFIRFAMALVVLIYHYKHFFLLDVPDFSARMNAVLPFYRLLWPIYDHGVAAVHVFWALSGFIFYHNYASRISNKKVRLREFAMLRFSRLYPLHFATLIVVAALQMVFLHVHGGYFVYPVNDFSHFLLQLCFASNWLMKFPNTFNGPIWSVSIEVLSYCIFYGLVRLVGPGIIVASIISFIGLICSRGSYPVTALLLCVFYFFLGGVIQHFFSILSPLRRRMAGSWNIALGVLIFAISSAVYYVPKLHNESISTVLLLPPAIFLALNIGQGISSKAEYVIVSFGNLTYASYLIHFPLQLLVVLIVFAVKGSTAPLYSPMLLPVFIISTLVVSRFVFIYFEVPAQEFLRAKLVPSYSNRNKDTLSGGQRAK